MKKPKSTNYAIRRLYLGNYYAGFSMSAYEVAWKADVFYNKQSLELCQILAKKCGYYLLPRKDLTNYQYRKFDKLKVAGKSYSIIPDDVIIYD